MTGMDQNPGASQHPPSAEDAWREVGEEFQKLGESLGAAFRAAWNNVEVRDQAQHAQRGLETLVQEVGKVVSEMGESPAVRDALSQTAKKLQTAGEETAREVRPHIVDALRQLNEELRKLADRMETGPRQEKPPSPQP